jgi:hypothetical protein
MRRNASNNRYEVLQCAEKKKIIFTVGVKKISLHFDTPLVTDHNKKKIAGRPISLAAPSSI